MSRGTRRLWDTTHRVSPASTSALLGFSLILAGFCALQEVEPAGQSAYAKGHMSDINFQLWEFEEAPPDLRGLVSADFRGGWLALISSPEPALFARVFSTWWESSGLPLAQCETGEGQIVLAGPHPGGHKHIHA